jgi:ribonucleoside-triphosphate reductase (formate)
MNPKSERIAESNHLSKLLNGGLLVQLRIPDNMDSTAIKKAIEKAGELLGSFRAFRKVPICSNCGLKEEKINEKCPVCKSPYILA